MINPKEVFDNPHNYIDFLKSKDFEGQHFDRKEVRANASSITSVKKGIIECVSSFANWNRDTGGLLVIGISNDGSIKGVNHLNEKELNEMMQALQQLRYHGTLTKEVSVTIQEGNPVKIYLLYTQYTDKAIYETAESLPRAYKREGPQCVQLSGEDKEQLKRDKQITSFELEILKSTYIILLYNEK